MSTTDDRKRCVACREWVQHDARLCPHCRTSQTPERWKAVSTSLKWIGGFTAVLSLVVGMVQINSLFQSWQERQETVNELVQAARMQSAAADYEGAWNLLDQALQLEPGSRPARQRQVLLAMQWLRNIRVSGGQRFTDIVERLLPALYRGAASAHGVAAADLFAHLGWADYLRYREGMHWLNVDQHFQHALEIDAQNVYAHAMQGFWLLWPNKQRGAASSLEKARQHFAVALRSGRERAYVRELQIIALLNTPETDLEARIEMVRVADQMRQHLESLSVDDRRRILLLYDRALRTDDLLPGLMTALPPTDHLATFRWLVADDDDQNLLTADVQQFFIARLTEETGGLANALTLYRTLQEQIPEHSWIKRRHHLENGISRVLRRRQSDKP